MTKDEAIQKFALLLEYHQKEGDILDEFKEVIDGLVPDNTPSPPPDGGGDNPDVPVNQDWVCYLKRYKDVRNIAKARNLTPAQAEVWAKTHFNRWGRAEGRIWGCQEAPEPVGGVGPKKLVGAGFIFKPVSDSRGGVLVLLLPASFPDNNHITVDGGSPVHSIGRTNGNKPTYFFSKPGGHYPNPVEVEINGQRYCVKDPDQRHDDGYLWECA